MARRTNDPAQCSLGLQAAPPSREVAGLVHGRPLASELPGRVAADPIVEPGPGRRRSFVVGRLTRRTREMRVLDGTPSPIRGPFSLRAVVRAPGPKLSLA